MELRLLSTENGKDVFDMLQRIGSNENKFKNEVCGMTYEEYKCWLLLQSQWANGENLPQGYVKQWTYWLYNDIIPLGYGKLREKVTEESRKFGGNIGFAIDPLYRGMGYGKILFKELLREAEVRKLPEVFSTVEKYNYPSKKIHEECGFVLVAENEERWFFSYKKEEGKKLK